jgi:uncharacterized membrane protein (UPF0127 family)
LPRAVLVVLCAVGLGGPPAGRAAAGCRAAPSAQDLRYAHEYRHLLAAKAAEVWPGWQRVPPLLQRAQHCEFLIGHPAPPRSFRRTTRDVGGRTVFAAPTGTVTPGPVAAPWKVGATWSAMVPTRDVFQRSVDRRLGRGAVRLSDTEYLRSLVHEAFHAYQLTAARGAPPSFGSTLEPNAAVALAGAAGPKLADEGRALAAALNAPSLAAARAQAIRFAARRAARRDATSDPAALAAFERQLEWMEGPARYADLRLVLLAGSRGYTPTRGVRYARAAAYRRAFLARLADPARRADGLRGRWEDLGAAEALLLDRLVDGWQESVLARRASLESTLADAVRVPEALAGLRVARIAVGATRLHVALAERAVQRRRGLRGVGDLRPLGGLLLRFGKDVSVGFTTDGVAMPLEIAFFARDGRLLGVHPMPRCTARPCPLYRSPHAFRDALEAPAGTLGSLRSGATLVVGGDAGRDR